MCARYARSLPYGPRPRISATVQVACVVATLLLIAFDAPTSWAIPVVVAFVAAVLAGERGPDHEAVDEQIETLDESGAPDLRLALVLAVVLHLAVLSGVVVVAVAESCSALALPFAVAAGAFGALRLHVAVVLAR